MRPVCIAVLFASTSALAQPAPPPDPAPTPAPAPVPVPAPTPSLTPIAVEELPEACRDLGKLAGSPSPAQAHSARISLAGCLVEQKLKTIPLCDCEQSVNEVEAAAAPSFTLLDEVFAAGDPATQILARQAQGDLLNSLATRLLATVPPPLDSSESAIALHETRRNMLTPLVNPMLVRARSAYTELDRIARANPALAKNRAVLLAVRNARAKLAEGIGTGVAKR
jgi:hypothetical protein